MIENLLNKIPLQITKFIEVDCPYCHQKHEKRIEYDFKINILQIDNKKRYQMYYVTSQIFSGTNEKYIGRATGTGYLTMEEAFNELNKYIQENEK
jgi:hypothetical protein